MNLLKNNSKKITFGLLTDFGFDFSIASMKALLRREIPDCSIIDIDHSLEKFSILSGAFVIEKVYRYFPEESYIIAIVDPGVGTERDGIVVKLNSYTFVGPNNGLFHYILKQRGVQVFKINEKCFPQSSNTFHGRDIFTPMAIQLAQGITNAILPLGQKNIKFCDTLESKKVITYIDSFGNIKTNIVCDETWLSNSTVTLKIKEKEFKVPFVTTFDEVDSGQLLCYKGSNKTLELAVNQGSARDYLQASVGNVIDIV
jgi:S-adenosyl-L-methionine hydrolase (adenosine-forming)